MKLVLESIGLVRSPVVEGRDEDWGSVVSELRFEERYAKGLLGIDQFSHVLVIYLMHKSSFDETDLVRRPRGRDDMPEVGIFAQRAKHRPNPIGVTAVKLMSVDGSVVRVQGLDAIDGTPIIDIKPYFPAFDAVATPTTPEWVDRLMAGYF